MKKGGIAAIVAVVVLVVIGLIYANTGGEQGQEPASSGPMDNSQTTAPETSPSGQSTGSDETASPTGQANNTAASDERSATAEPAQPPSVRFCEQAAGGDVSTADVQTLAEQGGLVALFQNEAQLAAPYDCARAYLANGGDIDAVDPRDDGEQLTPLLFAIKRNDPRMVRFVIDQGASLSKRAGPDDIKPYGYAMAQAFQNRSTNYNEVIDMLNTALREAEGGSTDTGRAGTGM